MDEDDLDELRRKRLQEKLAEFQQAQQLEAQKKTVLRNVCEPAAYERLMNVRLANPDLYDQIVVLLAQLMRTRQLKGKLTEAQIRQILAKITERKESTLEFKRKGGLNEPK